MKIHYICLKYYRKKYKYIPFRKINNIIKRKWQVVMYNMNNDNTSVFDVNITLRSFIRWKE
jgi:hypothetical protein